MQSEVQATCSALGYFEGTRYIKEPDCVECIKDLIRFLKRDDETCAIRRQLGDAKIIENDLIFLFKDYNEEAELFDYVTRLLVNLTQPAMCMFHNAIPEEKSLRNSYLHIESHLQAYKQRFVEEEFFSILTENLSSLFKLDWENRHESDRILIERLLLLIRNILQVPPNYTSEQRTDDDASVHDQILWVMNVSGLSDLILYVANATEERQYSMHILEIISLMFREQTAENLALACTQRAVSEKEKDKRELDVARQEEQINKREKLFTSSSRHSRFGGTFVVRNVKSISDRDTIFHKPLVKFKDFTLESNKQPKKTPKNRRPIKDRDVHRRSTLSIRLHLKDFCVQILDSCYNPLMHSVKDKLVREKAQDNDETYYLWAMRFFMEFCRRYSSRVDKISETMTVETFHYIHTNLLTYYEMIMTDKKAALTWSKRVHLALKAYQELLYTLNSMDQSPQSHIKESAKVIKSNIFYIMEFRDVFVTLLRRFDETRQSREYLKDLVESTHLFVKMLETFSKGNRHMVIEKRKTKKRARKKPTNVPNEHFEPSRENLEEIWDEIAADLSALCQGTELLEETVTPFDAASDVPLDQQRVSAMVKIQDCLRDKQPQQSLAFLRAAREVWPEGEFGGPEISPEEEFMSLREIFMTALPRESVNITGPNDVIHQEEVTEEVEEEEDIVTSSEQEFDFHEYITKFGKPEIIQTYCKLLGDFATNSIYTNHCIVKMLHRIAYDLKLVGMLFQLGPFRIFNKVLSGNVAKLKHSQEIAKFAKYIVSKFIEASQKNSLLFMEILFWKSAKEGSELVDGYGSFVPASKTRAAVWTEDQETQVRHLFEECHTLQQEGKDTVDIIMERLEGEEKTRAQVIRELKKQGVITSAKELKRTKPPRPVQMPAVWPEELEAELTDLYHQFKGSSDIVEDIRSNLSATKSKRDIINQLISVGIIKSKKELGNSAKGIRMVSKAEQQTFKSAEFIDSSEDSSDDDIGREMTITTLNLSEGGVNNPPDPDGSVTSSKQKKKKHKTPSKKKQQKKPLKKRQPKRSNADISRLLHDLMDKGWADPVTWIQRCLTNASKIRVASTNPQPVPIVPMAEQNEDAMEDQDFQDFLLAIGLSQPANEQEAFWRIPAELSSTDLTSMADSLDPSSSPLPDNPVTHELEDTQNSQSILNSDSSSEALSSDSDDSLSETPNNPVDKLTNEKDDNLISQRSNKKTSSDCTSDSDIGEKENVKPKKRQFKRKKQEKSDSDSFSDSGHVKKVARTQKGKADVKRLRKKINGNGMKTSELVKKVIDDDDGKGSTGTESSSDDNNILSGNINNQNTTKSKNAVSDALPDNTDSEIEESSKKPDLLDSSGENDTESPEKQNNKRHEKILTGKSEGFGTTQTSQSKKRKLKARFVDSDSEVEDDVDNLVDDATSQNSVDVNSDVTGGLDSDDEVTSPKRKKIRNIVDSDDSDDDTSLKQNTVVQKSKIIESDSD